MDEQETLVGRCADVLRREAALLEKISGAQDEVRTAVVSRNWSEMDAMFAHLDAYGTEFRKLETERATVFSELDGGSVPVGFYGLAARLDPEERKELTELYRRLKMDTLKVRVANDSLSSYLAAARSTVSGFLDAAFPDRKGKLYSRRGAAVPSEMRSIVLNRSF